MGAIQNTDATLLTGAVKSATAFHSLNRGHTFVNSVVQAGDRFAPPSELRDAGTITPGNTLRITHLRTLEAESIHVLREVATEFQRPVLLYSIGKDSSVLLASVRRPSTRDVSHFPCCTSTPPTNSRK